MRRPCVVGEGDHAGTALLVDGVDLVQDADGLPHAAFPGAGEEGAEILEQAAAAVADPGGQERVPDAVVHAEDMPIAQARGSAVGLYLWVWGRESALEHLDTGPEHVALDGDAVAVVAVENLLAQGLQ